MPRNTLRTWARLFLGGMTALAAALPSGRASASFTVVPAPEVAEATAAYKYANMSDVEAYAELDKRKIPYKKADPISGVLAPVRLTGKLHGVWIHSSIPESQRPTSVYEVLDARLALALDDFAKILERHDIEEVVHYSLYRPNVPREDHDVKEARGPTLAAALKADGAESKATASLAKAPVPDAKAAPIAGKPASTAKGGHPSAPAAKPGTAPLAKPGTAPLAKPAAGAVAKTNKPAQAKPAAQAKAQAPKATLPQLPNKALPQLPAKSTAPVHGAKHKAPGVSDKPALPATKGKAATSTATTTTMTVTATTPATPTATGPHPKTTANKAATPARARAATPAAPAKPAVAPQKGAKPAAPAKAPSPTTAPVSVKAPTASAAAPTASATATKAPAAPVSRQTWAAPGTRHPAGLAIDVALLKKRDGQWISVTNDFHGKIGAKTCGDGVRAADTPEARELRSLVCEANDQGVFTYVLTPNYNAAHYDHFHMEIRPQVKWFLYH